ncbi:MAG: class B sortase [Oscillospiraceae bacterium]|nr:class B sortase [Oscillospiraceae bacterium]
MRKARSLVAIAALLFLALCLTACVGSREDPVQSFFRQTAEAVTNGTAPDFAKLREVNPDVIAWLWIPDAGVNDPILRHADDDTFYRGHAWDGAQSSFGALYVEAKYNAEDFNDPVTVVYGSSDASNKLFASLQKTFSVDGIAQRQITLFTPEGKREYKAGQAGAFDIRHIMSTYVRFQNRQNIPYFAEELQNYHTMTKQLDPAAAITRDTDLLVLSTHLLENENQRFLVLAIPA